MSWWPFSRSRAVQRDFVKQFLVEAKKPIPGIRLLDQVSFVVLDTETTGLNPSIDHILSFGALKIHDQKILVSSAVEWYLKTSKFGKEAIPIHELLRNDKEVSVEEFATQLLNYLDNHVLVGHSIGFDMEMLKKALKPFGLIDFPNPTIDIRDLAIRLDHGLLIDHSLINLQEYTLDSLCARFKIKAEDRHTAGGDAFLTANLFLKLLKLAAKKGISNWGQLNK